MEQTAQPPIYLSTAAYAREHGELDLFRASHRANLACKSDIEEAISHHFNGHLLAREVVTDILDQYGADRVTLVLAATIQVKSWDGRFSPDNKRWASTIETPDDINGLGYERRREYAVASHPAVLNGYVHMLRQELQERQKTSIQTTLHHSVESPHRQPCKEPFPER